MSRQSNFMFLITVFNVLIPFIASLTIDTYINVTTANVGTYGSIIDCGSSDNCYVECIGFEICKLFVLYAPTNPNSNLYLHCYADFVTSVDNPCINMNVYLNQNTKDVVVTGLSRNSVIHGSNATQSNITVIATEDTHYESASIRSWNDNIRISCTGYGSCAFIRPYELAPPELTTNEVTIECSGRTVCFDADLVDIPNVHTLNLYCNRAVANLPGCNEADINCTTDLINNNKCNIYCEHLNACERLDVFSYYGIPAVNFIGYATPSTVICGYNYATTCEVVEDIYGNLICDSDVTCFPPLYYHVNASTTISYGEIINVGTTDSVHITCKDIASCYNFSVNVANIPHNLYLTCYGDYDHHTCKKMRLKLNRWSNLVFLVGNLYGIQIYATNITQHNIYINASDSFYMADSIIHSYNTNVLIFCDGYSSCKNVSLVELSSDNSNQIAFKCNNNDACSNNIWNVGNIYSFDLLCSHNTSCHGITLNCTDSCNITCTATNSCTGMNIYAYNGTNDVILSGIGIEDGITIHCGVDFAIMCEIEFDGVGFTCKNNIVCFPEPTSFPTNIPTLSPSNTPTKTPTMHPTDFPTFYPTASTEAPTSGTNSPSMIPTNNPTNVPSVYPTIAPSDNPSVSPTITPSDNPTVNPTVDPTKVPTNMPSLSPSKIPTFVPTIVPTQSKKGNSFGRNSGSDTKDDNTSLAIGLLIGCTLFCAIIGFGAHYYYYVLPMQRKMQMEQIKTENVLNEGTEELQEDTGSNLANLQNTNHIPGLLDSKQGTGNDTTGSEELFGADNNVKGENVTKGGQKSPLNDNKNKSIQLDNVVIPMDVVKTDTTNDNVGELQQPGDNGTDNNIINNIEDLSGHVTKWTSEDVYQYLLQNNITKNACEKLKNDNIDGEAFLLLTKNELRKDFNISIGVTLKILKLIKHKKEQM